MLSVHYGSNNIMAAHRDCCLRALPTAKVLCRSSTSTLHLIHQVMFSFFAFLLEIDLYPWQSIDIHIVHTSDTALFVKRHRRTVTRYIPVGHVLHTSTIRVQNVTYLDNGIIFHILSLSLIDHTARALAHVSHELRRDSPNCASSPPDG